MASVYREAEQVIFKNRAEIEEHLLAKVHSGINGYVGTELELFVTSPEGLPPTFDQIEMLLEHMAGQFSKAEKKTENGRIIALHIPDIGDICLEPGGQVELATKPGRNLLELQSDNISLRVALENAALFFGLQVKGQGHMPSFLQAEDMPRSRFAAYYAYCYAQHGEKASDLIKTMKSVCGLQINLDPMGKDFHEIYRALLLVDVAHSLDSLSQRQERLHRTYARLFPEQMTPVFDVLSARSNEEVICHISERLLQLKVPFIPDPQAAEGFQSTLTVYGRAPTVGEMLKNGSLTREILDNSLSLQLTMPNLRRHGVLETRAPDSVQTGEELMQIASQYYRYAYDPVARSALLSHFSAIAPDVLRQCFLERFNMKKQELLACDLGGGVKVSDFVMYFQKDSCIVMHMEKQKDLHHGRKSPENRG